MNAGWFNLILFLVLAGVIILCSFNVATYSDIKNGNTNAPDITDGECTAMIIINTILLVAASLTLIYYIYQIYQGAVNIFENEYTVSGDTVSGFLKQPYKPNSAPTQIFLWLFSTFAFIVSLFNLINATKINNSDANNAVSSSGAFLAFSWILMFVALVYFLYTTFRTLLPEKLESVSLFDLSGIFKKTLTTKPAVPQLVVGECKSKVNMVDFNNYLIKTLKLSGDKPFSVVDKTTSKY